MSRSILLPPDFSPVNTRQIHNTLVSMHVGRQSVDNILFDQRNTIDESFRLEKLYDFGSFFSYCKILENESFLQNIPSKMFIGCRVRFLKLLNKTQLKTLNFNFRGLTELTAENRTCMKKSLPVGLTLSLEYLDYQVRIIREIKYA